MTSSASSSEGARTRPSGDVVGFLTRVVTAVSDEGLLVACGVTIADLGPVGIRVAQAFLRIGLHHLAGLPVFSDQLRISPLGLVPRRVLPELRSDRHLRALGLVETVLEDVSKSVDWILDQRDEALAGQLGSLLRLSVVPQANTPPSDLLFASVFHSDLILDQPRRRALALSSGSSRPLDIGGQTDHISRAPF